MAQFTLGNIGAKETPTAVQNFAANGSGVALATLQTYSPAPGKMGLVKFFSVSNFAGGAPTVALQLNLGGVGSRNIVSGSAQFSQPTHFWVGANDTVKIAVTTLAAGSTFDYALCIEEYDAFS